MTPYGPHSHLYGAVRPYQHALCGECAPIGCPVLASGLACPALPGRLRPRGHPRFRELMRADPARWGPALLAEAHRDAGLPPPGSPPAPVWPVPDGRLRVGFLGPCYLSHGGTESWHQLLMPRLIASGRAQVVGYAVETADGDPARLGAPLGVGAAAARSLAASVAVLVVWGLVDLGVRLPSGPAARRPRVVLVNHTTLQMDWGRRVLESASPFADLVVGVSGAATAGLPAGAAVRPRRVIWNAVDPERTRPTRPREQVRAEWGVRPDEVAVLSLSRLSTEKRVPLLAEAIERLGPPYRLVVAGDGPERSRLEGRPRVVLLGRRDDVGDVLAAADLVAAASEFEGFGLSIAEAMAAGRPVVSTPTGVLIDRPELARLVPLAAGPDEWAAAIRADQADPQRPARVALARRFADVELAPDRFAREWEEVILDLAPPPPPPAPSSPSPVPRPPADLARLRACPHAEDTPARFGSCGSCRIRECRLGGGLREVDLSDCLACPEWRRGSPSTGGPPPA